MSRLRFTLPTTAEVALTTTVKTILQIGAPANHRVALRGFQLSFDGVSSTAGVLLCELCVQTTGTQAASAATANKDVMGTTEIVQSTGLVNFTAEPTLVGVARAYNVSPQTGYERAFAPDEEIEISGGTRVGLRITGYAGSTAVNVAAHLFFEE